ncbi:hypothetical protein BURPSPAST_V0103 [Burkholderia pseudomallei Pasteur 52237]|nr:hypothetical protein BURPSPAST_V0103 [Burkholderia pseudomallei Pasteur 52237]
MASHRSAPTVETASPGAARQFASACASAAVGVSASAMPASRTIRLVRSTLRASAGTGTGTAIAPAYRQPRKAATNARPSG